MEKRSFCSAVSLVFGIASIALWLVPPAGYLVSLSGLFTGLYGSEGKHKLLGTAGLILSVIGLILCVTV